MSGANGVVRIGRKGLKKFAFGDEGDVFEVDVVVAFNEWITIDDSFRATDGPDVDTIPQDQMPAFHQAAVDFAEGLGGESYKGKLTKAEALDFLARLREVYDELADFFQPKPRAKPGSPGSTGVELRFSEEGSSPHSTN